MDLKQFFHTPMGHNFRSNPSLDLVKPTKCTFGRYDSRTTRIRWGIYEAARFIVTFYYDQMRIFSCVFHPQSLRIALPGVLQSVPQPFHSISTFSLRNYFSDLSMDATAEVSGVKPQTSSEKLKGGSRHTRILKSQTGIVCIGA